MDTSATYDLLLLVQICALRSRIRQVLQKLIELPLADHPSMELNSTHNCTSQSMDLIAYIKALRNASLFPFPGRGEDLCLLWLGQQIAAMADRIPTIDSCRECGFTGGRWKSKLDAIVKTLNALLRGLMEEVDAYIEVFED